MRTGKRKRGMIHREGKKAVQRRKEAVVVGAGPWGRAQRGRGDIVPCRAIIGSSHSVCHLVMGLCHEGLRVD